MREECIQAVSDAAGRKITKAEARQIERKIVEAKTRLAREDFQSWQNASEIQRYEFAVEQVAKDIRAEAARKRTSAEYSVLRAVENTKAIAAIREASAYVDKDGVKKYRKTRVEAVEDYLVGNWGGDSIVNQVNARFSVYSGMMSELFDKAAPFLGVVDKAEGQKDVFYAIHGAPRDPKHATISDAWKRVTDPWLTEMQGYGARIRKLDDWRAPRRYHAPSLEKEGVDKFVEFVLGNVDATRMLDDNGEPMTRTALRDFAISTYKNTIGEGGSTKSSGEKAALVPGGGQIGNRYDKARKLFLKSVDAEWEFHQRFGGNDFYGLLMDHVRSASRDVELVRHFGVNAEHGFVALLEDTAKADDNPLMPGYSIKYQEKVKAATQRNRDAFRYVAYGATIVDPGFARKASMLRSVTAALLMRASGIAVFIGDLGTAGANAKYNEMNGLKVVARSMLTQIPVLSKETREWAKQAGTAYNIMNNSIGRMEYELLGKQKTDKFTEIMMRQAGINYVTEGARAANSYMLMETIGRYIMSGGEATADGLKVLKRYKVNEDTFNFWKHVRKIDPLGYGPDKKILDPQSILALSDEDVSAFTGLKHKDAIELYRVRSAQKLASINISEMDFSTVSPSAKTRIALGATRAGDLKSELARTWFLFKSFPVDVVNRYWQRAMSEGENVASRAVNVANFLAWSIFSGAIANWLADLRNGRDPRPINTGQNIVAALLRGGGLGLYGDIIFGADNDTADQIAALAGPVPQLVFSAANIPAGGIKDTFTGEKSSAALEAVKFGQKYLPIDVLYTKAAMDRMVWYKLMDMVHPGYTDKYQERMEEKYGYSYFWDLSGEVPSEGPDWSNIWNDEFQVTNERQ